MKIYISYLLFILFNIYKSSQKTLEEKMTFCIKYLSNETSEYDKTLKELQHLDIKYKNNESIRIKEKFKIYRKFNSLREPGFIPESYIKEESFILELNKQKGIVEISDLNPIINTINDNSIINSSIFNNIYLWKGDITRLKVNAIVNAANNKLLGCWQPLHNCIDNIIFSYSGVQLRNEMNEIMKKIGPYEQIGKARISKGYYLLSDYVIHTVGPYVDGPLTEKHKELLASSYKSIIELAKEKNIKTLAFCCISTGVFNFPNEDAAKIAIKTVIDFIEKNPKVSSHIKESLAPGIYLLDIPIEANINDFIEESGLDFMGRVKDSFADGEKLDFPVLTAGLPLAGANDSVEKINFSAAGHLLNSLKAELNNLDLTKNQREVLAVRIRNRLIVSKEQLMTTSVRSEILEAEGMDFSGKIHLFEAGLKENDMMEITLPQFDNENEYFKVIGRTLGITKQTGDAVVRFQIYPTNEITNFVVSSITFLRRLRF